MLLAPLRPVLKILPPFDLGSLPAIAAREHALLESRCIGEAADVAGLAIAIIQRRLRGGVAAGVPAWPDQITVPLVDRLRLRRGGPCQQKQQDSDRPCHGPHG